MSRPGSRGRAAALATTGGGARRRFLGLARRKSTGSLLVANRFPSTLSPCKRWGPRGMADVGAIICGKTSHDACRDVRTVIDRFPDLGTKCSQVLIAVGRQRQPVWMRFGRPVVVIEYVFLLPGKVAASIRAQAARLLIRYLSGDEALYEDVVKCQHFY